MPAFLPAELADLWRRHREFVGDEDGITFDTIRTDRRPVRWLTEAAAPLWNRLLADLLVDHRVVYCGFVVKHPDDASGMAVHDDQTFIAEGGQRSLTAWVPLVDTSPVEDNGWLGVIPRSHRLAPGSSGFGVAEWWAPYREVLFEQLVPVPAKAGDAILWDSRLLHGSPPNRSATARPALLAVIVPRDAELVHVRGRGRRERRVYRVDDEFHRSFSLLDVRRDLPDLPVVADVVDPEPAVSPAQVADLCGLDRLPVPRTAGPPGSNGSVERLEPVSRDHGLADVLVARCADVLTALESEETAAKVEATANGITTIDIEQLPRVAAALGSDVPHGSALVVIAPGARLVRGAEEPAVVDLVLAPASGSGGTAWGAGAVPFELGLAIAPPDAQSTLAWNDGDAAVVLLRVPVDRTES